MKTNKESITRQVILKDAKSSLAQWSHQSDHPLTVGDVIDIPVEISIAHAGYQPQARVVRVEFDTLTGTTQLHVEAVTTVPDSARPVVILNASLIPGDLRQGVEKQVRARLGSPVIEWEESFETDPVLRLHEFNDDRDVTLPLLQAEVRKNLHSLLESAGV